ncbi:MAG: hypothetical protein K0Q94_2167 [Paenibacillus sp.]|nr:hypothetical protein [Paenibacillus sp.]
MGSALNCCFFMYIDAESNRLIQCEGVLLLRNKRFLALTAGMAAALLLLAGCKSSPVVAPPAQPPPAESERGSLKIVYFTEDQFKTDYGNFFKKHHPDIDIQIIPALVSNGGKMTPVESSVLMDQKPDIVSASLLSDLSPSGKLLDLEQLMKQDQMEQNQFSSTALEAIRVNYGGGSSLVALSPSFQTAALYYNKAIFDRLNIPYPTSDMSWRSVLQLAERVARVEDGKQLYGLEYFGTPNTLMSNYIAGTGAESRSSDGRKAQYTLEANKRATNEFIDAVRNGAVYVPPENIPSGLKIKEHTLLRNKFAAGEAAMRIDNPSLIGTQKQIASGVPEFPAFPLSIVTDPINPQKPGQSIHVQVGDLFGIVSSSPNTKTAWQFIKFLIGPEMAAELEKTKPRVLSIRTDASKTRDGYHLEAFYSRKPLQNPSRSPVSVQTSMEIAAIATQEFNNMIYGRRNVTEGLQTIQDQVQKLLDQEFTDKK